MPQAATRATFWQAGAAMLPLLEQPSRVVQRRVESIRFLDDKIVRRAVSVDFHLPASYQARAPVVDGVVLAPIAMLDKKLLRAFDLRDESGASLPLPGRRQNTEVSFGALLVLAHGVVSHYGRPLEPEIVTDLHAVAAADRDQADEKLNSLFMPRGAAHVNRRLLSRDERLRRMAINLSANFLVFVAIDDPNQRRVVKFSYVEPFAFIDQPHPASRLMSAVGWSAKPIAWVAGGPGFAQTYHFEIHSPGDLEIIEADLFASDDYSGRIFRQRSSDVDGPAHLYLSEAPATTNGVITTRLRAVRHGLIRAAFLVGLLTAVMLTLGAVFIKDVATSAEAAGTVFVAIPAILAAYISSPGEHRLATRILVGVRGLVAFSGALALGAAASLLGDFNVEETLPWIWWTLAGAAWIAALGLFVSVVSPRPTLSPD